MAFYRRSKNTDKPLLKQIIDRIPAHLFQFNDLRPVVKKVEKPPEKTLFDIDNSGIQLELLL